MKTQKLNNRYLPLLLPALALMVSNQAYASASPQAANFKVLAQAQHGNAVRGKQGEGAYLNQSAREYLHGIEVLLSRYRINSPYFWRLVFDESAVYTLKRVEDMPCRDSVEVDHTDLPSFPYGCTDGKDTYLDAQIFQKAAFDQQVLGILHERLHAFAPKVGKDDHYRIGQMIAGIQTLIQRYQKQVNGDLSPLTIEELASIRMMKKRAQQLGFALEKPAEVFYLADAKDCEVSRQGGGCLIESTLDDKSFIGIGSFVKNAKISNTRIFESVLANAYNHYGDKKRAVNNSEIKDSVLNSTSFEIDQSSLDETVIAFWSALKVQHSKITNTSLSAIPVKTEEPSFAIWSSRENRTVTQNSPESIGFENTEFSHLNLFQAPEFQDQNYWFEFKGEKMDFNSKELVFKVIKSMKKNKQSPYLNVDQFLNDRHFMFQPKTN